MPDSKLLKLAPNGGGCEDFGTPVFPGDKPNTGCEMPEAGEVLSERRNPRGGK